MKNIPLPEFPRPEKQRSDWMSLNGPWDFLLFLEGDPAEAAFAAERVGYADTILVPYSWGCSLSGVARDQAGVGWYRRKAAFAAAERVFLCFGAVDYQTDVYVNGAHAGSHTGGYGYFELDVTGLWHAGENVLEVRAEDLRRKSQTSGKQRYGEVQGIWQPVWLEARPSEYIDEFRITARCDGQVDIEVEAVARDGAVVRAAFDGQQIEGTMRCGAASLRLQLQSPRLWSPSDPALYEGELSLGGDCVHTYFGVRELSARDGCLYLNGERIYLNGVLDQGYNPAGFFTYPDEKSIRDEVWRVKRLGLNLVRLHIKPEMPRKLYWLDRVGLLAIEDMPCFWSAPDEAAQTAYENELREVVRRDYNHPCIGVWVLFNETWGLLSGEGDQRAYLPETQQWLEALYHRAKQLDSTRLVEDNSPCLFDHVATDLNTWHFYHCGYETVRNHIAEVCAQTYPGSGYNYAPGYAQTGAPLMNSECGMVWGIDDSAGDSDIAWQYRYMLNEFRLHDQINGFVFTELNDVVNEFNGYYRIDYQEKRFGYEAYCPGMTVRDLHAADLLAVDAPPCQTLAAGAEASVPVTLSSFSNRALGRPFVLRWSLWHDAPEGRVQDGAGERLVRAARRGPTPLEPLALRMPTENALAVLSLLLCEEDGAVLSRNFITFDVRAARPAGEWELAPADGAVSGSAPVWRPMAGEKLCVGGAGEVTFDVPLTELPDSLTVWLEAGAKRVLPKDRGELGIPPDEAERLRGYRTNRGAYASSYWMTDESRYPSTLSVWADDVELARQTLANDAADARGALSWHAQREPRKLDEAGSYGELVRVDVPCRLLPGFAEKGGFRLRLRCDGGGLALYGRGCGRYPHGVLCRATYAKGRGAR